MVIKRATSLETKVPVIGASISTTICCGWVHGNCLLSVCISPFILTRCRFDRPTTQSNHATINFKRCHDISKISYFFGTLYGIKKTDCSSYYDRISKNLVSRFNAKLFGNGSSEPRAEHLSAASDIRSFSYGPFNLWKH